MKATHYTPGASAAHGPWCICGRWPCKPAPMRARQDRTMPTDEQLRTAAQRSYGVSCSQNFCKARGDDRTIYLPTDLHVERDDACEGTWITARIWIPDEDVKDLPQ